MSPCAALLLTLVVGPQAIRPTPIAEGKTGVIVGTTSPLAVAAGLDVLKKGGTAADAAVATSLAQVVECGGSYVSFAGIFAMMYFDAKTGQVYSLNAAYNTPRNETEPMTIPGNGKPSGRTALVPGFMAGVDAALKRFGKLPRKDVFEPAIVLADKGFKVSDILSRIIASKHSLLSRLPDTKRIFTKPDGTFFGKDDLFRQPEAANTLRKVADRGSEYMYTGDWAAKFVAAVRQEGGKVVKEDLEGYRATWESPIELDYRDAKVYLPGYSAIGGINLLEGLRLIELANFPKTGHYATSPKSLYWLIQIANCQVLSFLGQDTLKGLQGLDLTPRSRARPETTKAIWRKMEDGSWPFLARLPKAGGASPHSDGIVAIDQWGNVAAITHSINTISWGSTGLFVDGVSIPDSAAFQQNAVRDAGPGKRLPDPMCPLIVTKGGKPFLASSTIGSGLHQRTLQILSSILDFGMAPQAAAEQPAFLLPVFGIGASTAQVEKGQFDAAVLEGVRALGQKVNEVTAEVAGGSRGYWVGAGIDPKTGARMGYGTRKPPLPAIGAGY